MTAMQHDNVKKIWYRWKPSGAKDWARFVCSIPNCTAGGGGHRSTHAHTQSDFVYSKILQTNYSTQNITLRQSKIWKVL